MADKGPPSRAFTMESHQKYMREHVNPMLESLVTALLLKKPQDPVPFMVSWFSEQVPGSAPSRKEAAAEEEGGLSLDALRLKVAEVKDECRKFEDKYAEVLEARKTSSKTGPAGAAEPSPEDEEEEEEDDDDDVMEVDEEEERRKMLAMQGKGPRTSVSAEAYGAWNKKDTNFQAPQYPKTPEQVAAIKGMLEKIFMFKALKDSDMNMVVGAMQLHEAAEGTKVISQGEEGEFLYCVESGALDCYRKKDGAENKVKEYSSGEAFGELALLYNTPRAASVVARGACRLWKLDRLTFTNLVKGASEKRLEKIEAFVKRCNVLKGMDMYERLKVCEALSPREFSKGQVVVEEGTSGNSMYFVETGKCLAQKDIDGSNVDVMTHEEGDYFGELALMQGEPRQATVSCVTDCALLAMDRSTFNGLIGSMRDVLRRSYTSPSKGGPRSSKEA